ncbi:hypothetical protein PRIPAC_74436 [Pristionchus pacificus]|uniref:Uncharacterized protein n=1 Tax=Pristionchus pacificus TaxID=54126 RepID=A0A2A6CA73_PRIPA|nr:hypothetical protein PRIPAC_74436 [Pristionchus pacificus]|eukprot:PDM74990.1 hypothetical protein PRIPAC_40371 [Pristionchus pacificus]
MLYLYTMYVYVSSHSVQGKCCGVVSKCGFSWTHRPFCDQYKRISNRDDHVKNSAEKGVDTICDNSKTVFDEDNHYGVDNMEYVEMCEIIKDVDTEECIISMDEIQGKPLVPTVADIVKRKEKEWKQNKKDKEIEAKKKRMVKNEGESDNWYDDFFNHV